MSKLFVTTARNDMKFTIKQREDRELTPQEVEELQKKQWQRTQDDKHTDTK